MKRQFLANTAIAISAWFAAMLLPSAGYAGDRAQPSSLADSQRFEASTQQYTYRYVLSNPAGNTAPLDRLVIKLEPGVGAVSGIRSPPGWRALYSEERGRIAWSAAGYSETKDPGGNIPLEDPPSKYAVLPGRSLAGFSFRSSSPPGSGVAITQSYAPLALYQDDERGQEIAMRGEHSNLAEYNGFRLSTIVPVPSIDASGKPKPSVDGFLVFADIPDQLENNNSVIVVIRLANAGEVVDASTLRVSMNGHDITRLFHWSNQRNGYAAKISAGMPGTWHSKKTFIAANTLVASVEGIVPGTSNQRATDRDSIILRFPTAPITEK